MANMLNRLLNPTPMQSQSGAMPVMQAPQMQAPQMQQKPNGMNFMRDLLAGALLSYGGAGVGPVLAGQEQRRKQQMEMQQQALAQQQQNQTAAYFDTKDPELANAIRSGIIDGKTAFSAYQQRNKQPDMPTSYEEYQLALKDPRYAEMLRNKSPSTNVTVNTPYESEYDKKIAGAQAETFTTIQNEGRAGLNTQNTLGAMKQLASQPGFYSGSGGEDVVLGAKRLAASMGLDPNGVDSMETFNALAKQAALSSMGGSLGAGFSNADRDFVMGQVPGLNNTPEGNSRLIDVQGKVAQRKVEIAQFARDYAAKNNGRLDYRFEDELRQWAEANPLFPQEQQQPSGPVEVRSEQEALSMPPGTIVILNGRRFKVE